MKIDNNNTNLESTIFIGFFFISVSSGMVLLWLDNDHLNLTRISTIEPVVKWIKKTCSVLRQQSTKIHKYRWTWRMAMNVAKCIWPISIFCLSFRQFFNALFVVAVIVVLRTFSFYLFFPSSIQPIEWRNLYFMSYYLLATIK